MDNLLLRLKERGESFLDETLRMSNVLLLFNDQKIKSDFELKVIRDTTAQIDSMISDIIDWMVEKNSKEWKRILASLETRNQAVNHRIQFGNFEVTRKQLLETLGAQVHQVAFSYDKENESKLLSQKVQQSMFQAVALTGASALGMGALLSVSLLDFTGILGASAVAAVGLCVIPYRRVTVKKDFDQRVGDLRERILSALNSHFEDELQNNSIKLRDAVSPFSTFVQKEEKHLQEATQNLDDLTNRIQVLQRAIQQTKNSHSKE